ncbi:MAG: MBL fold metallo-hydrolase [Sphingomonadales bacterium]|nr:MBL fold metallo-hydrolase [Sphingomonadales bacterium]
MTLAFLWRRCLAAGLLLLASGVPAAAACPALRWTTLGTAGGPVPTPERSEPANLLTAGDQLILVDTGDGTVDQLARLGLGLAPIRSVFISHHHWDHTGGLAAVIGLRWMNGLPGVLTVYGPPGTQALVAGIVAALGPQSRIGFGVGALPSPPAASVRAVEIGDGARVDLGPLTVTAVANSHFSRPGAPASGDAVSLSYRFQLGGRAITYTGDTGPSEAVTRLARGSDLLVSEAIDLTALLAAIHATQPDLSPAALAPLEQHLATQHLAGDEIGRMAAVAGVRHLLLTHLAIAPGPVRGSEPALRGAIARAYAGPVDVGIDLASYDVGCAAAQ